MVIQTLKHSAVKGETNKAPSIGKGNDWGSSKNIARAMLNDQRVASSIQILVKLFEARVNHMGWNIYENWGQELIDSDHTKPHFLSNYLWDGLTWVSIYLNSGPGVGNWW